MVEEAQARRTLYNTLMKVPHGKYSVLVSALREAMAWDPDFTARACVHICTGGSKIRDQVDSAIIALLQSPPVYGYRESGRCIMLGSDVYDIEPDKLPGLPPFRVFRVWDFMRSNVIVSNAGEEIARFPSVKVAQRAIPKLARKLQVEEDTLRYSVNADHVRAPRLMSGIMTDYVRMLEADSVRFDGVVLRNRKAMKAVYRHYRIPHSDRVNAILFNNDPPADSKLAVLKEIANSTSPREQMCLITENRIPYPVAASVLPKLTPATGIILISAMTPTEALNSRAWVERSGLLNIAEVKDAYVAKVQQATKSVATAEHRLSTKGADEDVEAAVSKAKEKAVAKAARIEGVVDIYLDTSYSMMEPIKVAPKFAERIFPLCEDVRLFTHNDYARQVRVRDTGRPLYDVQQALKGVRAGGATLHHAAFEASRKIGREPDKIVLLTDGGDNRYGEPFVRAIQTYERQTGKVPMLVMIHFQGTDPDTLTPALQRAGYPVEKLPFEGDYYIFDQAAALLGGPPAIGIIERIMDIELPRRIGR